MMANKRYVLLILLPLHFLTVWLLISTDFSYSSLIYFLIGYVFIYGIGVNVGLHRCYSHRSIMLKEYLKPIVLLLSILSSQGHPIWWAAVHRGIHHRYSDTDRDEHSPKKGFMNSLIGWIFKHDPKRVNYKFSVDLLRNPQLVTSQKYYEVIIYSFWIGSFFIDPNLTLFGLLIPSLVALYGEGLVNTICHSDYGYKNFETSDNSKNNLILGYITWGNGWHNNHHYAASSFDFGRSISGKNFEYDPCMIFQKFMSK